MGGVISHDSGEAARMRISDADRDRAASVLGHALAEGRLTAEEHSERLDAIFAAKTHADIAPVVSDLPGAAAALVPSPALPARAGGRGGQAGRGARVVAVFSAASRKGVWQVPAAMDAVSVFSDTELDLRQATLAAGGASIRVTTVFGTTRITVPPEMHVVDDGWALFGGREIPPDSDESAGPDAPVLRISGVSIFGLTTVRREPRPGN
jgi:hypothetical protein